MQIKQGPVYRRCTYQQLVEQAEKLAAALLRHDLRRGDRMAIVAENRPEWLIAYLAIVAAWGQSRPLGHSTEQRRADQAPGAVRQQAGLVTATTWPLLKQAGLPLTVVSFDPLHDPDYRVLDEWVRAGLSGSAEKRRSRRRASPHCCTRLVQSANQRASV